MITRLLLQSLFLVGALWCYWGESVHAQEFGAVNQQQIDAAIARARQHLLTNASGQVDGQDILGALALLKSGTDPSDPLIKERVDRILQRRFRDGKYAETGHHVYDAAVALMVLANVDRRKYKPQIAAIADYIISRQAPIGHWNYSYQPTEGDTSLTQYAILALWEAQRAGVEIPPNVWDQAAAWHIRTQLPEGGFAYNPGRREAAKHSMTAAGIGTLHIARQMLYPNSKELILVEEAEPDPVETQRKKSASTILYGMLEPLPELIEGEGIELETEVKTTRPKRYVPLIKQAAIDVSIDRAVKWMARNFTVEKPTGYHIYFMYALERCSALGNIKSYGDRDWYNEGASYLVKFQVTNGSWIDEAGGYCGAAFGVLFLSRATQKSLHKGPPRVEFGAGILVGGRGLPDDLSKSELDDGKVKAAAKPKSSLEELLVELEKASPQGLETAQSELVEQVTIADKTALIGQGDRLRKLAVHPNADVRRTAMWAMGRCEDLSLAPLLIRGLSDEDVDVFIEARNGLRCLSRRVEDYSTNEAPLDKAAREQEQQTWKRWYLEVRPYDERNDLPSQP